MDKLKNKDVWLIIIFILLIVIMFFITKRENESSVDNKSTSNYTIVTDANDFFTVEGCVNRYIGVLSNKENKNMIKLLDSEYIKKESITEENVFNKISPLNGIFTFNGKEIYYEKVNKDVYKYYAYGKLKQDTINGNDLGTDYYLIITMNKEKLLFNVTPYDGMIFKEGM